VSLLDLFETARRHVESHPHHHVLALGDSQNRLFGYICDKCKSTFLISVEDYDAWLSRSPPEMRRLISFLVYKREHLCDLLNAEGDMLQNLEPLSIELGEPKPAQTAYQRIMSTDDD